MIQNTGHRENKDLLISQCIEFIVNVGVLLIDCDRNQLKTQFRSLEKREIISLFLFENAYPALYLQKSLRVEHQRLEDSEHQLGEGKVESWRFIFKIILFIDDRGIAIRLQY